MPMSWLLHRWVELFLLAVGLGLFSVVILPLFSKTSLTQGTVERVTVSPDSVRLALARDSVTYSFSSKLLKARSLARIQGGASVELTLAGSDVMGLRVHNEVYFTPTDWRLGLIRQRWSLLLAGILCLLVASRALLFTGPLKFGGAPAARGPEDDVPVGKGLAYGAGLVLWCVLSAVFAKLYLPGGARVAFGLTLAPVLVAIWWLARRA